MSAKATNLALLWTVLAAFATGVGAFLAGSPRLGLVIAAHSVAGCTVGLLFAWKRRIILRSLRRRPPGPWLLPSVGLLALVVVTLGTGLFWSTVGLPSLHGYSAMTVHALAGTAVAALLVLHSGLRWPRVYRRDIAGRRALLRGAGLIVGGFAVWRTSELVSSVADWSGAGRRFTGSRLAARFTGNDFPSSNWLTDDPEPIDRLRWRLEVTGHVERPLAFAISELGEQAALAAVLDCTGGWYTAQEWTGISLGALLDEASVRGGARSVVVRASTGYWRRFTLSDARTALLAMRVGGEALSHAHGAPLRLVMPGKRGYEWVKWVTSVEVSTASPLLKWPLPIS